MSNKRTKMLAQQRAFAAQTRSRPGIAVRVSVPPRLSVFNLESRIGKEPIKIPKGVTVTINGQTVKVKGPLGALEQTFTPYVNLEQTAGVIKVSKADESRMAQQQHGLVRTLTSNMVVGVSTGYKKVMELVGTGYRATVSGKDLTLNVGYCVPQIVPIPEGVKVTVEKNTTLTITGYDKVKVGDFCATVRLKRAPEPYKGKGIRYQGEVIKLKAGKAGGKKK